MICVACTFTAGSDSFILAHRVTVNKCFMCITERMRRRAGGPVGGHLRRNLARGRPRSVIRRYLPCLRQTTGTSDTDSEQDSQLSSLLNHQHQPGVESQQIPGQLDPTTDNSQVSTYTQI
jgi:hypothetical protein